jgi:hypothetical protein
MNTPDIMSNIFLGFLLRNFLSKPSAEFIPFLSFAGSFPIYTPGG